MTNHDKLIMHREKVRVSDKKMLSAILDMNNVACVALYDDPYPYIVPMNYGYEWDDKLVFYFHMAKDGHRINLINRNPNVSLNINSFLDRQGFQIYRKENHDYRSVTAYGTAEIISPVDEEAYKHGFSILNLHNNRSAVKVIAPIMYDRLLVLKITAEIVTGKSQYPISTLEEVSIPKNVPKSEKHKLK